MRVCVRVCICECVSVCVPCTSSACNLVTAGGVVHKDTPLWGPWRATPRAGLGVGGDRDLCSRSVCGNQKPGESGGQSGQEGRSDDLGRLFPEGGSAAEARLGPGQVGTPLPPASSPALQTPEFWVRLVLWRQPLSLPQAPAPSAPQLPPRGTALRIPISAFVRVFHLAASRLHAFVSL